MGLPWRGLAALQSGLRFSSRVLLEQVEQEADGGGAYVEPSVGRGTGITRFERGAVQACCDEPSLFLSELFDLLSTSFVEAAGANELNRTLKFEFVEPGAVRLADVHDHMGALRELDAVHQFAANGAGDIADVLVDL